MKNSSYILMFLYLFIYQYSYGQDVTGVITHESANGANDGAINLSVMNGFAPYSFSWKGPAGFTSANEDISGLAPGQYCVTVTDALCGTATFCGIVRRCNPILGSATGVLCPYNSNGVFTIILSGQGPFTVQWSDGVTSQGETGPIVRRTGLDLGVYCVTVTNAWGCSETLCRAINTSVQPIQVTGEVLQPTCGMPKGSITLAVTGGYAPYSYQWSDNSQTKDRTDLTPGEYCVTVSDNKGCTQTACFTVSSFTNNIKIMIAGLNMISDCFAPELVCDGSIDIEVSGGTGPYTYLWSGPGTAFMSNQQDISGLCDLGNYSVTVTDQLGCTKTDVIKICCCDDIGEPGHHGQSPYACNFEPLQIFGQVSSASSTQGGSINITVYGYGSAGDYSIIWKKNGQFFSNEKNLTNLQAGTYCVTVSNGCTSATKCFTVVNCDLVTINISGTTQPACQGYPAGAVSVNVSGGTAPYTYKWSDGSPNQNLSGLTAGSYTVTVFDKNGCTAEKTFTVSTASITIQNLECTQITYCGNQVVNVQEFGSAWQFNPSDCRYARIICGNGYVGPWEYLGFTLEYPFGPTGCQIRLRCLNNQILQTFYGQTITESIGGISSNCTGYCTRVRYCYYPELNWIDPASVVVLGNGTVNYSYYGQSSNCTCCAIYHCCKLYYTYCDGNYVGISEECCQPAAPGDPGLSMRNDSIDYNSVIEAIRLQHPEYVDIDWNNFTEKAASSTERPKNDIPSQPSDVSLAISEVFPNPFNDQITVKVFVPQDQLVHLSLLNAYGQLIQKHSYNAITGVNSFNFLVNGVDYPAGSYIIRLTDNAGRTANKLIVKAD